MSKKKNNTLSILSLVFGVMGLLFAIIIIGIVPCIISIILGVQALSKENNKGLAIGALVSSFLGVLIFALMMIAVFTPSNTEPTSQESIQTTTFIDDTIESEITFSEPSAYIYYADIADNYQNYLGKRVRTTVPISQYYSTSIVVTESIENTMYVETDTSVLVSASYATVVGTVSNSGVYAHLTDVEIEYLGNDAPSEYWEMKSQYEETKLAVAITERNTFIESAVSVTYDDLRRYPDSYRNKAIKLTIYFKSVEPDGWILQGDMIATIPGTNNEIAVYDGRAVREPRFMEGDTITVYATGNGLSTLQIKNGTGLLAEVIDEYEIPSIKVVYTDLDNLETLTTVNSDSEYEDAREAGEKAAETLNKLFE